MNQPWLFDATMKKFLNSIAMYKKQNDVTQRLSKARNYEIND